MAIANYPVLQFKSSLTAFLDYVREYNEDKPLKQRLRPQHVSMFTRMLTLVARQLYQHNRLFNDTPELRKLDTAQPFILPTNRKALSWLEKNVKIDENSAYRHVNRLIEAEVITKKVNHGTRMNFELWINPEFLLITDLSEAGNESGSEATESGNKAESDRLHTNCRPGYRISRKEHFNNPKIAVERPPLPERNDSAKGEVAEKNLLKEHREITQHSIGSDGHLDERSASLIHNWNRKEPKIPPGRGSKLREYQKSAAHWFFWYVMVRLFEGRVFNPAHLENTLVYVERNYFVNCGSFNSIERTRKLYQWRIDKARGTIERHGTDMRWIFPGHYLNLDRSGTNPKTGKPYMSFANTASWPAKYEQFHRQKEKQRKEDTCRNSLHRQIRLYTNNPCLEQYRWCEAYIRKNIPHLMPDFLGHFSAPKTCANV